MDGLQPDMTLIRHHPAGLLESQGCPVFIPNPASFGSGRITDLISGSMINA